MNEILEHVGASLDVLDGEDGSCDPDGDEVGKFDDISDVGRRLLLVRLLPDLVEQFDRLDLAKRIRLVDRQLTSELDRVDVGNLELVEGPTRRERRRWREQSP